MHACIKLDYHSTYVILLIKIIYIYILSVYIHRYVYNLNTYGINLDEQFAQETLMNDSTHVCAYAGSIEEH